MAGYNGYSKSNNAVSAEGRACLPLTHAVNYVAEKTGIKKALAKKLVTEFADFGEWHHTSKFYNVVKYYEAGQIVVAIEMAKIGGVKLDYEHLSRLIDEHDSGRWSNFAREYQALTEYLNDQPRPSL